MRGDFRTARLLAPLLLVGLASSARAQSDRSLSAEELKELDALQQTVGRFESAQAEFKGTVASVVKQEYENKRKTLTTRYDAQVKAAEKDERVRRDEAIALFEKFLAKYPADKRWTPDVIFRLAELYFEKTTDDYMSASDSAAKVAAAVEAAGTAPPSVVDYAKTIELYRRLITEFPDYRLVDGAQYLMGYCLDKMGKEMEARQSFLAIVCSNKYKALDEPAPVVTTKKRGGLETFVDPYAECKPIRATSRFVPEAWTRIGEYHFDYVELELAIAAYQQVLKYKDSPYLDKALYKLGWSYYRIDHYIDAIKRFDEVVVWADTHKLASGKEASELRPESLQYLGISFAEKDWNGDGIDDPEAGLQRAETYYKGREAEPHVREVFQRLGDIYFDQTEFPKAIEAYKYLLQKWPVAADNPKVQDRIVLALERQRKFDEALKEREVLAREYGKNSEWYKHNRDNKEAIDAGAELAEQALVKYAVEHHRAAQALKKLAAATTPPDAKKLELAGKEYALAADGYAKYLDQYRNSKNTYEYTFYYAESLYYAGRYGEAAAVYEKVRDSNLDNKYLEDGAMNAILSYEKLVDADVKAGRLVFPPIPEAGKQAFPFQPLPIPELVKKLESAYDAYAKRVPSSARLPTMLYKTAETEFRYLHWDDARPRFEDVMKRYCGDSVAIAAGKAILTSYTIENNLDKILEWTDKITNAKCGTGAEAQAAIAQAGGLKRDARFKKAQERFDAKDYEVAATMFLEIVKANPTNEGSYNDKALNNAAIGFENVKRFFAATKVYEKIVQEYPKSEFVDEALYRTAVNYQRFFEFDKAVVAYQRLADDPRFANSKHRTNSLYNSAVLLENDQAYVQAAEKFIKYSTDKSLKREDAAEAFFRAGLIYLKAKDNEKAAKIFKDYLKNYGTDPKRNIEANFRIAETLEAKKDKAGALAQYKKVEAMGAQVPPASEAAEYAAHAAFIHAEQLLPPLEKAKISGGKDFARSLEAFKTQVANLTREYEAVLPFKRATWALAAYFRIGYVYERLSKSLADLVNAPCPPEVMKKYKQEGCDMYLQQVQAQIEPVVASVDEEVVKRYRTTLDQAAKLGVSNEWTKLARRNANAFKPEEFPILKDERVDYQMETP